ncbi:hypothetical protein TUM12151_05300 [Morganella morganii]|nr:hypothetical protein TUM12149_06370 [Morganella morganii]GIZ33544.1 hypothetical protein TUM12151_05300 [Morganella morganii]
MLNGGLNPDKTRVYSCVTLQLRVNYPVKVMFNLYQITGLPYRIITNPFAFFVKMREKNGGNKKETG